MSGPRPRSTGGRVLGEGGRATGWEFVTDAEWSTDIERVMTSTAAGVIGFEAGAAASVARGLRDQPVWVCSVVEVEGVLVGSYFDAASGDVVSGWTRREWWNGEPR